MTNRLKFRLTILLVVGYLLLTGMQRAVTARSEQSALPAHGSAIDTALPTVTATPTPISTATFSSAIATPTFVPTAPPDRSLYLPLVLRQEPLPLRNGDFEQGNVGWQESSTGQFRLIFDRLALREVPPHNGEWAAWLGGKSGEISELSQKVTVPVETPFLRYWTMIRATTNCGADTAALLIDNSTVDEIALCTLGDTDWIPRTIDLRAYAGLTATLIFRVEIDRDERHSNLYLDDIEWLVAE